MDLEKKQINNRINATVSPKRSVTVPEIQLIHRAPKAKTSRRRLRAALQFQETDRIPIDLGGFQTGIHQKAYKNLLKYLGINEEIVILDPVQQLAKPSEADGP